jgi:choline monooxygenase
MKNESMSIRDYMPESDLSRASTIPAQWYLEPEMLQREKRTIFWETWQPVCRPEFVAKPGDYFAGDVQGEPILVVRGEDGQLRAFFNVCRHRAGPVAVGAGNRKSLQCRYHGWTYSLDGKLLAQPDFEEVRNWEKSEVALPQIAVRNWGPYVWVNLSENPISLEEIVGKIPTEISRAGMNWGKMQFVERRDYTIACNWKVYVDNYLEGYHIPMVHPGLFKELDYENYRVNTFRYSSSQDAPIRSDKKVLASGERQYSGIEEGKEALYYWIFPNFMISIYPDHFHTSIVLPLDENKTLTVFEWFFQSNATTEEQTSNGRTIEFTEEVQQQDIAICEAVQRGLRSRSYNQGRYSVKRENGVHHFHGLLHEFLTR